MRRMLLLATVAVLAALGAGACTEPAAEKPAGCAEQKAADEAAVRATRWDPPAQLADLGEYVEIHWQARALGDPCSRAPGPTDWSYQGVVKLRPEDARALAARPGWQPATPEIWPALAEFAPPGASWQRADGGQAPTIYLDAANSVALFAITTS
jgi:hypothetical protein